MTKKSKGKGSRSNQKHKGGSTSLKVAGHQGNAKKDKSKTPQFSAKTKKDLGLPNLVNVKEQIAVSLIIYTLICTTYQRWQVEASTTNHVRRAI